MNGFLSPLNSPSVQPTPHVVSLPGQIPSGRVSGVQAQSSLVPRPQTKVLANPGRLQVMGPQHHLSEITGDQGLLVTLSTEVGLLGLVVTGSWAGLPSL